MNGPQYDGTEPGTAAMLYAGAITGVLLRGTTWVLSAFTIGPVLGLADTVAGGFYPRREMLFVQTVVTVIAVLAAILGGLGLQTDAARTRRPVRLLCALFIVDALVYLAPVVAVATVGVEITTSAWALFAVAVVGNLGLAGLAVLIIARTGRPRAPLAPAVQSPAVQSPAGATGPAG